MWRRTFDTWAYSPLEQIDRGNVGDLRMVWSRALAPGMTQGTPLIRDGVMYMPNPRDVIQALDGATGDLIWEYRRSLPDDVDEYFITVLADINRNLAVHDNLIIDTSVDDYVFALDAATGRLAWETQILDYRTHPANQTSRPHHRRRQGHLRAELRPGGWSRGRASSPPTTAATGAELWRTRLIPAPGEPGDESWGDVPYEERKHVGAWMVPSFDPELNLLYIGTSVTSPAPKFMLGGDRQAAPVPQLDARARRRHGRDRLVLPAPERPLGPRSSLRADPARHGRRAGPGSGELDQPAAAARRGAQGGDRHSRQDRASSTPSTARPASSCGPRRRSRRM